ncbi:hypothetical protein PR048_023711 [Dryococelus australis]|uniref:Uncharacterized protein n=1 Tax=Dryococelus australis TaxID=614101 RepID=A0ABQ9GUU6_9NEOP|nr:hypothetical protein PR048_023711 [Dryococelus australis]
MKVPDCSSFKTVASKIQNQISIFLVHQYKDSCAILVKLCAKVIDRKPLKYKLSKAIPCLDFYISRVAESQRGECLGKCGF